MYIIKFLPNQALRGGIMKFESAYPVICTDKLSESRDFYTRNFNLSIPAAHNNTKGQMNDAVLVINDHHIILDHDIFL